MILYRHWMVFTSLVIDLIGQLNYHIIGCKTRKAFDPSVVPVSLTIYNELFITKHGLPNVN